MGIWLGNAARIRDEALAEVLAPPPPVDFEAWAAANVVFTERESAMPGPYNPERFRPFSEILAALGPDDPCRVVTVSKGAQIGGTVIANLFLSGALDLDPGDFLYCHPTEENARRWSKLKLMPMIRASRRLSALFPEKSRDGGDSVLFKERFDGRGSLLISGANSPASLSQISMRRQVQDDLAKWAPNSAGDPETQADSRSSAFDARSANRCSSRTCQSVDSTALRRTLWAAAKLRPGRSEPWSWVAGFSSSIACSTTKLANFSSPALRRTSALRPSPTKTKAS